MTGNQVAILTALSALPRPYSRGCGHDPRRIPRRQSPNDGLTRRPGSVWS
jgi:hypothetical protein